CTNNGKLLHTGITGHRPCAPTTRPPRQTRRKGGIVELQITATRLLELAHNPTHHRWWAPLINDLARQHTAHTDTVESATPNLAAADVPPHAPTAQAKAAKGAKLQSPPSKQAASNDATPTGAGLRRTPTRDATALTAADADKRRAGAALRRYVQTRGRVCSWPGCRTPATKTDQDHAIDYAAGGATLPDNLHLACRHDHRAKH
ncbi:HNH endonuclease signature motif containing protein, partial [Planotetraspora thailandica]|uniref:HNH endonuclease signature motif containing protein n=1 Tax=Planotetraspora thailandica TaxID=487172 RepID=UPI0035E829AB